jgi:hypothetical protein
MWAKNIITYSNHRGDSKALWDRYRWYPMVIPKVMIPKYMTPKIAHCTGVAYIIMGIRLKIATI